MGESIVKRCSFVLASGLLFMIVLAGCGEVASPTTATGQETPTEAAMAGTPAAGGTPGTSGTPTLSDPRQVVQDFLASLQATPDGSASLPYLSTLQQDRVAAGKTVASLLGIQN